MSPNKALLQSSSSVASPRGAIYSTNKTERNKAGVLTISTNRESHSALQYCQVIHNAHPNSTLIGGTLFLDTIFLNIRRGEVIGHQKSQKMDFFVF